MPASAIKKITLVIADQEQFWSRSHGWAPSEAANLLAAARLDRQLSFVHTLCDYLAPFPPDSADARQILGYTTLRSLCEGTLKLFFSVYVEDYIAGRDVVCNKGKKQSPEKIKFDKLILLYIKHGDDKFRLFLERIQQRGNAIHHFCNRDIGTQEDLIADIIEFEKFLLAVDGQMPYP